MIKKIIVTIASVMPNILKIPLYRMIGYKIGKNVKVGFMTIILGNDVTIEDKVKIGALNFFKMNKLSIGANSRIRSLNMMIGPKDLKLGKRVQIVGPFTFMNLAENIELDDRCGIGSHSVFYTHGVYLPYTEGHPRKFGGIYLGKRVWSPAHVVFLPGVSIGNDSIIVVGSVINKSFPEDSLISGIPAKMISKANRLKTVMTRKELHKRMKEIIYNFMRDPYLQNFKIEKRDYELIIKNKKQYLIKLQFYEKIPNVKKYDEVIIFGENIPKINDKKVSSFDLKRRKKILRGKLGKRFSKHLKTYGEYFD